MIREFARIGHGGRLLTRHQLRGQAATRAAYVILDHSPQGTYLYRYDTTGDFVGDTWHASIDDARQQAAFEYEADLGQWTPVPVDQVELGGFAQGLAAEDATSSPG